MEAKSRRPAAQATHRKASSHSAKIVELPVPGRPDPNDRLSDPGSYINRELSWLDFDARVLAEAQDPRVPLLERVRFLAITSNNLDEFYMIRVASLKRQLAERVQSTHADLMTPTEQLRAISKRTREIVAAEGRCLREDLAPNLERERVRMVLDGQPLSRSEQKACDDYFEAQLYPLLTPLAIDPPHPLPVLGNRSR
jgi:polyphosphate kinase